MRNFLLSALCLLCAIKAAAVPADTTPAVVTQPDGTQLTIALHGDEFYSFTTTADGYTVVKDSRGYYTYATLNADGALTATQTVARDAQQRTQADRTLLATLSKGLTDLQAVKASRAKRAASQSPAKITTIDYSAFRGLVVLVNFQDVQFTRTDVLDHYNKMINQRYYTGYTNEDGSANRYGNFTGSVRDYYYDNSMGKFDPQFDIVGPVTVDYSSTDMNGASSSARSILATALQKLQSSIDFSKYDTDNDGIVDMVYFIVAGHGSHVSGNNSGLLWPHKWQFPNLKLGGKWISKYACSTELCSGENSTILDGIGTICHEFSHVLGLPDLYDTNYATDGQSHHPGQWDVMASGGYLNNSRTPAGYSAWERYTLGFMTPKRITGEMSATINPLNTSNEAYILPSLDSREYFMLENRQWTKWDYYLPGHGMVVARVDSTESWAYGVNTNIAHNHYELLRAGGSTSGDYSNDSYPGTSGVTMISNFTVPSLCQWNGTGNEYYIDNIAENNSIITFNVIKDSEIQSYVETFEDMPVTTGSQTDVQGKFAKWNFTRCQVGAPDSTKCDGKQSLAMAIPSIAAMATPLTVNAHMAGIDVYNTSSTTAKFILEHKGETDSVWSRHSLVAEAPAQQKTTIRWNLKASGRLLFRITAYAGPKSGKVYVDNFSIFGSEPSGVDNVIADWTHREKMAVTRNGLTVTVSGIETGSTVTLYGASGQKVATTSAGTDGRATLEAPCHGFYVVNSGNRSAKIAL